MIKNGEDSLNRKFNVDQVPMPFAIDSKTTYEVDVSKEEKRDHRVWVSNPNVNARFKSASHRKAKFV